MHGLLCQEICRLLLEGKADPNNQTLRGFTPMHFAMQHGKCCVSPCPPNAIAHARVSLVIILSLFCSEGYSDIVLLLKKHGANVLLKSSMGQLPGGHSQGLGSEFEIKKPFY